MTAPQDPGVQRDSLVRAQFAPDARRAMPDDPARLALVLDNHDTVTRLVRVELSGPLARYTRPRRQPRLELLSRRQQEVTLEVRPEETRPEGGHTYDLTAVVVDEKLEQVVFTTTARIGVERAPGVAARAGGANPDTVVHQGVVHLKVHVRNTGNVPLLVDAQKVNPDFWVRDEDRRKEEQLAAARRAVRGERVAPRTPERLRPRQAHDFDILITPPPYYFGVAPRRWWVPVGVRGEDVDPECVFVDFVQRPRIEVEKRMVWLAGAVAAALLVLIVFMVVLAT
ncbi:MAG: hypothetical protein AVDCRST_MAG41-3290 [uncultured Corynebacteriales bacterium]|uniref:Uncharacterized protein n=1 Tax=uncultured Mycobacteriales bacterium TaxID=581187 RepID=A0A6J4JH60_9ACTN|nr:MAG: hypothetical protein AVDCRST_MAG41-3290 [uncultured Corynebacteriales bacterium]